MSASSIIRALHARGVSLSVHGGSIRYDAPPGAMSNDLLDAIRAHKAAIIEALTAERHWTNPRTGQAFVTRLARCERCGFACWGEVGEQSAWACLICHSSRPRIT